MATARPILLIGAPLASDGGIPFFGRAYVVTPDPKQEVDPLDSSTALNGFIHLSHLAWDVGGQVDVNEDGQDDLLLGSYWSAATGALDGSGRPLLRARDRGDARTGRPLPLRRAAPESGLSLASLGDVTDDGTDDFAVGSPGSGTVYVVGGDADWAGFVLLSDSATRIAGPGTDMGQDILGGDWTGDGVGDVVTASYQVVEGPASVHLFEGPFDTSDVLQEDALAVIIADDACHDRSTLADAGDTDGDGDRDLAVGLPNDGQGSVQIYMTPLTDKPEATFVGGAALGQLGLDMDGLGDTNGDGFEDLAIGAPSPLYGDHRGTVVVDERALQRHDDGRAEHLDRRSRLRRARLVGRRLSATRTPTAPSRWPSVRPSTGRTRARST